MAVSVFLFEDRLRYLETAILQPLSVDQRRIIISGYGLRKLPESSFGVNVLV
jgi:hypothetical protein